MTNELAPAEREFPMVSLAEPELMSKVSKAYEALYSAARKFLADDDDFLWQLQYQKPGENLQSAFFTSASRAQEIAEKYQKLGYRVRLTCQPMKKAVMKMAAFLGITELSNEVTSNLDEVIKEGKGTLVVRAVVTVRDRFGRVSTGRGFASAFVSASKTDVDHLIHATHGKAETRAFKRAVIKLVPFKASMTDEFGEEEETTPAEEVAEEVPVEARVIEQIEPETAEQETQPEQEPEPETVEEKPEAEEKPKSKKPAKKKTRKTKKSPFQKEAEELLQAGKLAEAIQRKALDLRKKDRARLYEEVINPFKESIGKESFLVSALANDQKVDLYCRLRELEERLKGTSAVEEDEDIEL